MYPAIILALFSVMCVSFTSCSHERAYAAEKSTQKKVRQEARIENGRYMIMMGSCNDCHTPHFMENFDIPQSEWLVGSSMGFKGPWGTTYPLNLRRLVYKMTEDEWVKFASTTKGAPPMPWITLHKMKESDLRDIYVFIKSLGMKGEEAPAMLPPGEEPKTPYVVFEPVFPKQ